MEINIDPRDLAEIKAILMQHLIPSSQVWVFGSRIGDRVKPYSDIDLAIDLDGKTMPLRLSSQLAHTFEESNISIKVDVVDYNNIDVSFKKIIDSHKVPLRLF